MHIQVPNLGSESQCMLLLDENKHLINSRTFKPQNNLLAEYGTINGIGLTPLNDDTLMITPRFF